LGRSHHRPFGKAPVKSMKKNYVFLCSEQPEHELSRQCFMRATKGSLSLFPSPRKNFAIVQLSFLGIVFAFMFGLVLVATILGPDTLAVFWILLLPMILWCAVAWPWAVRIAFRYAQKKIPGVDLRVREVKPGLIHHRLRVEAGGRKTLLIITSRRQTITDALQLSKTRK
jgi:hypothetical protein